MLFYNFYNGQIKTKAKQTNEQSKKQIDTNITKQKLSIPSIGRYAKGIPIQFWWECHIL